MRSAALLSVMAIFLMTGPALADMHGKKHEMKKSEMMANVPRTITDAFVKSYPNGDITNYEKKEKDGKTMYKIEAVLGNLMASFMYNEDGSLYLMEEEMTVENLPQAVMSAVSNKHPDARIKKAEKVTKGDEMRYEVTVMTGDKYQVMTVAPDGNVLASETKEKHKKHDEHMKHMEKEIQMAAKEWHGRKEVGKADIPETVRNSFASAFPNATVTGYGKEDLTDRTQYEIDTKRGDRDLSYVYTADGALMQVEEEVSIEELPEMVRDSILKKHPNSKVLSAYRVTKGEKIQYEIALKDRDKHRELLMSNQGEVLASREIMVAMEPEG